MKKVYSNILDILRDQGHEIGLHGRWHEFLNVHDLTTQKAIIREMIDDLGVPVYGANFMGRMNTDTISAMAANDIKYFVYPLFNYYRLVSYPRSPTNYYNICTGDKSINVLPINVQTYDSPWFSVKNMLDSAIGESAKSTRHVSVLCHPFRDGSLRHIGTLEKMLDYLINERKLSPLRLKDFTGDGCKEIRAEDVFTLKKSYGKIAPPHSKRDVTGFIPENLTLGYKFFNRGRTIW